MGQQYIDNVSDYIIWFYKDATKGKYRQPFKEKSLTSGAGARYKSVQIDPAQIRPITKPEARGDEKLPKGARVFLAGPLTCLLYTSPSPRDV